MSKKTSLPEDTEYANFDVRLYASVIDLGFLTLIIFPLQILYDFFNKTKTPSLEEIEQLSKDEALALTASIMQDTFIQLLIVSVILIIIWWKYGTTPGKKILGLRIVHASTHQRPHIGQWIMRVIGYILSALPLTLGFFLMYIDKRKQCLHDKIANTVVLRERKNINVHTDT